LKDRCCRWPAIPRICSATRCALHKFISYPAVMGACLPAPQSKMSVTTSTRSPKPFSTCTVPRSTWCPRSLTVEFLKTGRACAPACSAVFLCARCLGVVRALELRSRTFVRFVGNTRPRFDILLPRKDPHGLRRRQLRPRKSKALPQRTQRPAPHYQQQYDRRTQG